MPASRRSILAVTLRQWAAGLSHWWKLRSPADVVTQIGKISSTCFSENGMTLLALLVVLAGRLVNEGDPRDDLLAVASGSGRLPR